MVALALLATLLLAELPTSAEARVVTLTGRVLGDANSRVTMRLVKRRGVPRVVRHVLFRNLDHGCADEVEREFNVILPRSRVDRIGITNRFTFFELLTRPSGLGAPNDKNQLVVTGKMGRGAGRIAGTVDSTIRLAPVAPAIANACVSGVKRRWVATRSRRGGASASGAGNRASASAARTQIVHISTRRDAGIFTMDPDGRRRHRLRGGLTDSVAVSASGRRIAFSRSRPTPCSRCPADFFTDVLVANGKGREARLVKRFRHTTSESLALSPDGRWIAIVLYRGAGADLYLMRADGSGVRRLTKGGGDESGPSFSPDGRRIAFSRERNRSHIFSVRRGGGGLRQLTRGNSFNRDPAYSPDGRRIAFSRSNGGDSAIFTMRADGSGRRRLTTPPAGVGDVEPDFSPNGRSIVFARGLGVRFDLHTIRTDGRNERRAAHAGIGLIDPDWTRRP